MQNKTIELDKQQVIFKDLGIIEYKAAWDYQEELLQQNLAVKRLLRTEPVFIDELQAENNTEIVATKNYLLFCEHPSVYTLGKSGKKENVLMSDAELQQNDIAFFATNRGGDITFHGLQQLVGYPILDLENFYTDIGKYLRNLEEVIIQTIAEYGIIGHRSKGETGVWIEPDVPGRERKICAIGVRCSRWITMHGFALNVNTDLSFFNNIIPCGIVNKQVTSFEKELGRTVNYDEVKEVLKLKFAGVFGIEMVK